MMHFCTYVFVCACFCSLSTAYFTRQWVVHVEGGRDTADAVARDHGFTNLGEIFDGHYHFHHSKMAKRSVAPHVGKKVQLAADTRIKWSQQQKAKRRVKRDIRLMDSDPRWPSMWYLNRGNGLDMNVIPAWMEGVTGKGAVVTILDDGLEKDHPDLVQNYDPMASYDVNNEDSDPSPRYDIIDSNRHGTRCAGEVAATSNNSVCALGVAHGAQVGGVRMLDGEVTDAVEARSLSLNPQHIDIYSASWGPDDDGKTVDGPGEMATRAFREGVAKGRNGKGSIFVWASGNGGKDHDNCNCDGYTNSIYSLSISSATEQGHVPWYSEACSSTLASTYSSGAVGEKQIVTTDLHHSCTSSHTGTSASAPLAAGICALALEANPKLTWRDMQHIVVRTARPQHLIASDWQTNGVGRNVSHSFGYGLMDAYAMVQLARKWITVPEQHKCEITAPHVEKTIPAKSVVVLQLKVNNCAGIEVLEHVQAKLTIFSHRRGDLNIQLTSPMGTRVTLLAHRVHDISRSGFNNWPFMSVHSWGETPYGTWQLEIHNDGRLLGRATLQNWSLILYGTKYFNQSSNNSFNPTNNVKFNTKESKKKSNKKGKNKSVKQSTVIPKNPKGIMRHKSKNLNTTPKYTAITNTLFNKSKKMPKPTPNILPFFYSTNNSKFRPSDENVKEYLRVNNISITYPVMIPAPDTGKSFRKLQKQKEKSRDLNSNRNRKQFSTKNTVNVTTATPNQIDLLTLTLADKEQKTTANVTGWDLVLYGTTTPPAIDLQTNSDLKGVTSKTNQIDHNSIDTSLPSGNWNSDAEIRKEMPTVDEQLSYITPISGCNKTNGQICIECQKGEVNLNGKCVKFCPEGHFLLHLEKICMSCHYTCKGCSGSSDYECTECYPDSILTKRSESEQYCYPHMLMIELNAVHWYYKAYVLLIFLFIIVIVAFLWYTFKVRRSRYKWQKIMQIDSLTTIRNLEKNVKNTVYSDSE